MRGRSRICAVALSIVGMSLALEGTSAASLAEPASAELRMRGKVVFASDRDGDYEIFVISHRATRLRQLTFNEVDDYSPSWSPDGRRIAFTRELTDLDYELMTMNADGSEEARVQMTEWPELDPAWSPDGKWIAYSWGGLITDGGDVRIMQPDGEYGQTIAASDENTVNRDPAWSPGSRRVAFVESYDGSDIYVSPRCCNDGYRMRRLTEDGYGGRAFPRCCSDGDDMRRLTEAEDGYSGWAKMDLDWSPDGRVIGFTEQDVQVTSSLGTRYRLGLVDPKTKDRDSIPTSFYSARFGAWDAFGDTVVFFAKESWDAGDDLHVTSLDGMRRVRLTTDPSSDIEPDWFQPPR